MGQLAVAVGLKVAIAVGEVEFEMAVVDDFACAVGHGGECCDGADSPGEGDA